MTALCIVLGVLLAITSLAVWGLIVTGEKRIDRLLAAHHAHPDLVEHMRVIESLSQRIQAPERARWDPMPTESPLDAPEAVDTILDEDYWISKEALAEKYLDQMRANGSDD